MLSFLKSKHPDKKNRIGTATRYSVRGGLPQHPTHQERANRRSTVRETRAGNRMFKSGGLHGTPAFKRLEKAAQRELGKRHSGGHYVATHDESSIAAHPFYSGHGYIYVPQRR